MKLSRYTFFRNRFTMTVLLLFAMLVMASPVLANSSNYSWLAFDNGRVINGKDNGVFHSMTAGTLTNSGSLWVTRTLPNPPSPEPFTIEVWKDNTLWDTKICSTPAITPSWMVGPEFAVSYSKNCGSISTGSYYLIIWRSEADGREVQGSGTLVTQ